MEKIGCQGLKKWEKPHLQQQVFFACTWSRSKCGYNSSLLHASFYIKSLLREKGQENLELALILLERERSSPPRPPLHVPSTTATRIPSIPRSSSCSIDLIFLFFPILHLLCVLFVCMRLKDNQIWMCIRLYWSCAVFSVTNFVQLCCVSMLFVLLFICYEEYKNTKNFKVLC